MIRKYMLPLAAIAGVVFAVMTVIRGQKTLPAAQPVASPALSSFVSYVAGAGIIEASSENISIGTPIGNVVTEVFVKVGDRVKAGQPLFRLRDSVIRAELATRQAALDAANARLSRLRSMPRPEEIPPAEARVAEAESFLADMRNQLSLIEQLTDKRAVSQEELDRRRFAVQTAQARLRTAQSELALLKAGSWRQDILVAEAEVASAQAQVRLAQAELDRHTVLAPVDGQVLQVKIRPGEYAQPGPLATPLMLLGDVERLYVRVDVDENDAWRVARGAPAEAFVRGNASLRTPLTFVRIEPYVVPKRSLTGDSTERVDTRVLQILYSFERDQLPVYVGQQMDVFIEARPVSDVSGVTALNSR